jgi:glycosyltransferase involved in cell wall biosynthesis
MKVAIVHEWFVDWAGSETVVEQMLNCFPKADLFALADFLPGSDRERLLGKRARTTFVQRLPFASRGVWRYLPLLPIAIEQLDLRGYDLVISSSHAVAKGVIVQPDQVHVSYVHSPMRYAWDMQQEYLSNSRLDRGVRGALARTMLHYLRLWDHRTANGVDRFAANSKFVARRIWRTYRREATVIYPPVDVDYYAPFSAKGDFYLAVSRMVPYKRLDTVVRAFSTTPERRLVIVGSGPEESRLRRLSTGNIEFLGHVPRERLREMLQKAKAFVFPALEDFGILPVEAQACGTPVIAYGRGGALETVVGTDDEEPTGVFFASQDPDAIRAALDQFEREADRFASSTCRANAMRFSQAAFRQHFEHFVMEAMRQ